MDLDVRNSKDLSDVTVEGGSAAPRLSELRPPPPYPVKGFVNRPNSCFMNSIVQLIVNSPLADRLKPTEQPVNSCLVDIVRLYHSSQDPVISLYGLRDALNNLREGGLYHENEIYDAAEFFQKLSDHLDSSLLKAFKGEKTITASCELCHYRSQYTDLLQSTTFGSDQLFEFPFHDRKYLHELMRPEEYIVNCFCGEVSSFVVERVSQLPQALLLEVSRAEPMKKCHKYAFFAEEFEAEDDKGMHRYRLSGVLYHKGLQSDGHYTCKVRASNGEFYYVDDGHVEESFVEERSATATLLLYFRCDTE